MDSRGKARTIVAITMRGTTTTRNGFVGGVGGKWIPVTHVWDPIVTWEAWKPKAEEGICVDRSVVNGIR